MAALQIYDKLLSFPLFQGMSHDDLEIVAGHTRLGFQKVSAGHVVVKAGDACTRLCFLINGAVKAETTAENGHYRVEEQMNAPYTLQQDAIFGYYQRYNHTYTALTDVNLLTIDKEEVVVLLEEFLVFRLNFVNMLSTQSQKQMLLPWRRCPQSLYERVVRFFSQHSIYPAGQKTFYILMEQLAEELNDSRLNVSRVLNKMQVDGLVELRRGRIIIPQLERLLM